LPHLAPHRCRHCFAVDRPSHDAGFVLAVAYRERQARPPRVLHCRP
jgi:hypothetical protein